MRKTIQEILFQPQAWRKTIQTFSDRKAEITGFINRYESGKVILTGCGTSYYLSLTGSALYTKFTGRESRGVPASEIMFFPSTVISGGRNYLLVSISRSGKTAETLSAMRYIRESAKGGTLLISCTENSEMAKYSDLTIVCPEAAEETRYMTKSFTSMLLGFQLMTAFTSGSRSYEQELVQLPEHGERLIREYQSSLELMAKKEDFKLYIYLGHGQFYGIAAESMLKIKEMACTPAEAFHGMEFMHGPKYAVNNRTLITYLLSDSISIQETELLKRIKDLGGHIMVICDKCNGELARLADDVFELKSGLSENSTPVLIMLLTQLYGYYRALAVGKEID
jgi:glucosamine--fructose-6-phosphate aminotransferase (isomerizing)